MVKQSNSHISQMLLFDTNVLTVGENTLLLNASVEFILTGKIFDDVLT